MSDAPKQNPLSPGDFGLLLQDILRQFARDVEASPVRPGMSVEEFSPRFEAMRDASSAIMAAAARLTSPASAKPEDQAP